jgi:hypothetical protein
MKLTPDIIRTLIKEEIESLQEFQPGEQTFTNSITDTNFKIPVDTLARGLVAQCKNTEAALTAVIQSARRILKDRSREDKTDTDASNSLASGVTPPTANRKEP